MTKLEFMILAINNQMYKEKAWLLSHFGILGKGVAAKDKLYIVKFNYKLS